MASSPTRGRAGTVVITGASSGIGRCTARRFAGAGWSVGLIARGEAGLRAAHAELAAAGPAAAAHAADVADSAALERAASFLEQELGPFGLWINCAGNGVYSPFLDETEAEFRRVTEVTYLGTVNGTRVALRRFVARDAGAVVNVCSAIAFHGLPILSSYSGAKSAVRGFGQSVRHELEQAGSRVRLVTVFPPAVNTPFFSHAACHIGRPPRPAKPVYQPEVVADAILLASASARGDVKVSGVTVVFAWAARAVPGLVDRAVHRLGAARQTTDDPEAARLRDPTVFAPSGTASGARGPFDAEARGWSAQVWAARGRALVRGRIAGLAAKATTLLAQARGRDA